MKKGLVLLAVFVFISAAATAFLYSQWHFWTYRAGEYYEFSIDYVIEER